MNDASWGPRREADTGSARPGVRPAAPAGPTYDERVAQQTRPMPIVPDVPAPVGGVSGMPGVPAAIGAGNQDDSERGPLG